jgi:hypothetical protein
MPHALYSCSGKTRQGWRSEEYSSGGRCTDTLSPLGDKLQGDIILHQQVSQDVDLHHFSVDPDPIFNVISVPDPTPHQSDASRGRPWL